MTVEYVLYGDVKGERCACRAWSEDYLRVDGVLFCPKCAVEKWNRERSMPGVLAALDSAMLSLETEATTSIYAYDRSAELVAQEIKSRGLKLVSRTDEPDIHRFVVAKGEKP